MPDFDEHAAWLRDYGTLDVGVHLNLTAGEPLTDAMRTKLARWGGRFAGKFRMAMAVLAKRISVDDVRREWRTQIERCCAARLQPVFLNSHEHIHMLPALFPVANALAHDYGILHLRFPSSRIGRTTSAASLPRAVVMQALGAMNRRHVGAPPLRFLGMEASGKLVSSYLERVVPQLRANEVYELMCHPGLFDANEVRDTRLTAYHDWEGELRTLTSPATRELLGAPSYPGHRLPASRANARPDASPRLQRHQRHPDDMDARRPELLSVVVPAHNEASGIAHAVEVITQTLSSCGMQLELIVVDDGSRDDTFERVLAIARSDGRVKGIRFTRNFGKEAALLAGLQAASGDAVVTIDSDLQHPPQLIPTMIEEWRKGSMVVDAVKRSRENDGAFTRARARLFNSLLSRFGGIDLQNASDFKLLDRRVVDTITSELPERQRFYRGLADWVGYRHASVPFDVEPRAEGKGSGRCGSFGLGDDCNSVVHQRPIAHRHAPRHGYACFRFWRGGRGIGRLAARSRGFGLHDYDHDAC